MIYFIHLYFSYTYIYTHYVYTCLQEDLEETEVGVANFIDFDSK